MKTSELRTKTKDQLEGMLKDLKKEQFNLRFQKTSGELEKVHRINEVRKTIAKIKTLFNQPEQANAAKTEKKAEKKTKKKAAGE